MPPVDVRSELGHPYGIHRVLDSAPRLPQAAEKLDNSLPIYANEILIQVERLNIDAASFVQMEQETGNDHAKIREMILQNCRLRGKQQNRVTGSGGMLLGTVAKVGPKYRGPVKLKKGQRISSLVSLSLTPLSLEKVGRIDSKTHQVEVEGHAILFERTIAALMPKDLPEAVAMAVFDVAGAPATVFGLCQKGQTIVVIGAGGKAGILSCAAGRRKIGRSGRVIAIEPFAAAAQQLRELNLCDEVLELDATNPIAVQSGVSVATRGKMGDVVINVASVPNTENSAILSARRRGKVVFFSMATSFTKVALGAEGLVSDATLLFGNGYYPNHSRQALGLLRTNKALRELFFKRYT